MDGCNMDLIEFLEEKNIEYWTSGKNVSSGWINICCPFCSDASNHMGIKLNDLRVSCWRCGSHKFIDVIIELTHCSYKEAKRITNSLLSSGAGDIPLFVKEEIDTSSIITRLPQESTTHFPKQHLQYLKARGFRPAAKFVKKYKLQAVHTIGKYKFRIIIPIFMNRQLVSFTSRGIVKTQSPKYLSAGRKDGKMNIKSTIYNYDHLPSNSDAIVVEGPLDVWKLGDGAVSTLGVKYTDRQIILLKNKNIRNLFIIFDDDLTGHVGANSLSKVMAPLVKRVEIVRLQTIKDPGALSLDDASMLKYQLGFKNK
jgi:DNA primase